MSHFKLYEQFLNESKIDAIRKEIHYETYRKDPVSGNLDVKHTVRGKSKMIDYAGRKIVLFDINGVNAPFYLSTGHGGKKDVTSGKWYPFFGIGPDGWLNKLKAEDINTYYGIEILKNIAHKLDSIIGDIRNDTSIPRVKTTGAHIDAINKDLTPTENEVPSTLSNFQKNLENFKKKLNAAIS